MSYSQVMHQKKLGNPAGGGLDSSFGYGPHQPDPPPTLQVCILQKKEEGGEEGMGVVTGWRGQLMWVVPRWVVQSTNLVRLIRLFLLDYSRRHLVKEI